MADISITDLEKKTTR